MAPETDFGDEQDQSELFDEDNLDEEPGGISRSEFKTFEEIPDLFDVTRARGDARDDPAMDEADFDEAAIEDEDLEDEETREAGSPDEDDLFAFDAEEAMAAGGRDEVELVYAPDVEGRRGAQSSAAHFESRGELNDADLEDLGYADKDGARP